MNKGTKDNSSGKEWREAVYSAVSSTYRQIEGIRGEMRGAKEGGYWAREKLLDYETTMYHVHIGVFRFIAWQKRWFFSLPYRKYIRDEKKRKKERKLSKKRSSFSSIIKMEKAAILQIKFVFLLTKYSLLRTKFGKLLGKLFLLNIYKIVAESWQK